MHGTSAYMLFQRNISFIQTHFLQAPFATNKEVLQSRTPVRKQIEDTALLCICSHLCTQHQREIEKENVLNGEGPTSWTSTQPKLPLSQQITFVSVAEVLIAKNENHHSSA